MGSSVLLSNCCLRFAVSPSKHKIRTFFPPSFVSMCIIFSLQHCFVSVCEFAWPVLSFLCTGARPEICLSAKNIRIPAQEGWLGFWAAWAEGQRGEERWRQQRRKKTERKERKGRQGEESVFSGPFPSSQILISPPRALFPRSSGAEHAETAL